jgi:hypothetical protein
MNVPIQTKVQSKIKGARQIVPNGVSLRRIEKMRASS